VNAIGFGMMKISLLAVSEFAQGFVSMTNRNTILSVMKRFDQFCKEIWMQMVHGVNEVEGDEFF